MKDKILEIVREAIDLHVLPATHKDVGVEIVGVKRCMRKISAELDKILAKPSFGKFGEQANQVSSYGLRYNPTPVELSDEDIAKIEACGFIYDKERNIMIRK